MTQKVEIEQMEAAFKRAAEKAMHGTREERSGRFTLSDDRARQVETQTAKLPQSSDIEK